MVAHDIVVIGGSAGALDPLLNLLSALPADFPAAIFVALHTSPDNPGVLPGLLARAGPLSAAYAVDQEPIRTGHVYVAPPNKHLVVKRDRVRVTHGPKENGFRPAVDPLFRTAAAAYGPRVVGVILSGGLDDGTYGLMLIKDAGGVAIVQQPDEASVPNMPRSALENVEIDHVAQAMDLGPLLSRLAVQLVKGGNVMASKEQPARRCWLCRCPPATSRPLRPGR